MHGCINQTAAGVHCLTAEPCSPPRCFASTRNKSHKGPATVSAHIATLRQHRNTPCTPSMLISWRCHQAEAARIEHMQQQATLVCLTLEVALARLPLELAATLLLLWVPALRLAAPTSWLPSTLLHVAAMLGTVATLA